MSMTIHSTISLQNIGTKGFAGKNNILAQCNQLELSKSKIEKKKICQNRKKMRRYKRLKKN